MIIQEMIKHINKGMIVSYQHLSEQVSNVDAAIICLVQLTAWFIHGQENVIVTLL